MIYTEAKQINPYLETYIVSPFLFTKKNSIEFIILLCTGGSIFLGFFINPFFDLIKRTL